MPIVNPYNSRNHTLTSCKFDAASLIFEGQKQYAREHKQDGTFAPIRSQVLWQVFGKRTDSREKGSVCWAEFEPFEGHLRAIW